MGLGLCVSVKPQCIVPKLRKLVVSLAVHCFLPTISQGLFHFLSCIFSDHFPPIRWTCHKHLKGSRGESMRICIVFERSSFSAVSDGSTVESWIDTRVQSFHMAVCGGLVVPHAVYFFISSSLPSLQGPLFFPSFLLLTLALGFEESIPLLANIWQ